MSDSLQLEILLSKQALYELQMTYCRAIDRRDNALLATVYHDDAIEDRGPIFCGTATEFIAWTEANGAGFEATVHRVTNTLFVIDGDKAQGEIYAEAYHRTVGEAPMEITAGGRYIDHYEKRNGKWGIVHRSSTIDRCEMHPVNQEAYGQFVAGSIEGQAGEGDLSYQLLSAFGRFKP